MSKQPQQNFSKPHDEQRRDHAASENSSAPQSEGRDLSKAPVWRFVLPFLVVFLAFGQTDQSWANDEALYRPEISENAAFVRIVNFSDADKGGLSFLLNGEIYSIDHRAVSPYFVVNSGFSTIQVAEEKFHLEMTPGQHSTLAFADQTLLGQIDQTAKTLNMPRSKAGMSVFNFTDTNNLSLTARGGKVKIFEQIASSDFALRTLNPISLSMGIVYNTQMVMETEKIKLQPNRQYSVLVAQVGEQSVALFTENRTRQP